MAFSDFKTVSEVLEAFQITYRENDFVKGEEASPSEHFLEDFEWTRRHVDVFASEGARCEAAIFPVLKEVYKPYAARYALWIKKSISYSETLSGTPDYFVSTKSVLGRPGIGKPLVILVEAKKNDFEVGWGQCLAALVAAQRINGDANFPVYGIVTDGIWWQFGRLIGDAFTQNRTSFSVDNLPGLFGALDAVFKLTTEDVVVGQIGDDGLESGIGEFG